MAISGHIMAHKAQPVHSFSLFAHTGW